MISKKSRAYLKRSCLLLSTFCVIYFLFIHGLSLRKTDNRPFVSYSVTEAEAKDLQTRLESTSDEMEIIKRCNEFACEELSFHKKNNLKMRKANCVGYAQYTAALLNYAFKHKSLKSKARPVVGQVHLYGFNLHPLTMSIVPNNLKSFFKDHDFVEIIKENGDTVFIDTSLQDLLGKTFI